MSKQVNRVEIIVDCGGNAGGFLVGFGDGSGQIDRRQGGPRWFADLLQAADTAELWAQGCQSIMKQYPEEQRREVRVVFSPAYWAALEAEKKRLAVELGKA